MKNRKIDFPTLHAHDPALAGLAHVAAGAIGVSALNPKTAAFFSLGIGLMLARRPA